MEETLISPDFTAVFEVRREGRKCFRRRAGCLLEPGLSTTLSRTRTRQPRPADPTMPLLDVDRLTTAFPIEGRVVSAVSGVSFSLDAGETLALVGESGCGKSLTALSILRLVDPPGRIVGGAVRLDGRDLLTLDERAMRSVRGREIGLVLQEPMTRAQSRLHRRQPDRRGAEVHGLARGQAGARPGHRAARRGPRPGPAAPRRRIPAPAVRRPPPARADRRGARLPARLLIADEPTTALDVTIQAEILDLLRDLKTRLPPRAAAHHPRPRRRRAAGGSRRRDVRRPHRRRGAGADPVPRPEAPLHARPAGVAAGPARHAAAGHRGHRAAARPRSRPAAPSPRAARTASSRASTCRRWCPATAGTGAASRSAASCITASARPPRRRPGRRLTRHGAPATSATSPRSTASGTASSAARRTCGRSIACRSRSSRARRSASSASRAAARRRPGAASSA